VPGMKGRFQDIVRRFKERQASQKKAAPEAAPVKGEPPRSKFEFRLPTLGNRKKAEGKRPEKSEKRAPRSKTPLLFGLLGVAVVLGALFLAPRMTGGKELTASLRSPPPPQAPSSPPPPAVPALPTTPTGREVKPTPPGASNGPSEEREARVPVPKKARNPFGDPEDRSPESSARGSSPGPSAASASLPPPPVAPKELPPLPPPPTSASRERASAQPPPPLPEVACLAVFLGKEASAVVKAGGFEGVVSVGEAIPGVGKLVEVRPDGCLVSIGERKLAVSLEGEKRWK
jgi:hypothetical protein